MADYKYDVNLYFGSSTSRRSLISELKAGSSLDGRHNISEVIHLEGSQESPGITILTDSYQRLRVVRLGDMGDLDGVGFAEHKNSGLYQSLADIVAEYGVVVIIRDRVYHPRLLPRFTSGLERIKRAAASGLERIIRRKSP